MKKIVISRVQNERSAVFSSSSQRDFSWNGSSSDVSSPWDRSSRGSFDSKFSSAPSWKSSAPSRPSPSPFDYPQPQQDRWSSGNSSSLNSSDMYKSNTSSYQTSGRSMWEPPQEKKSWNAPNRDIWCDKPSPSQFQNNFRGSPSGKVRSNTR